MQEFDSEHPCSDERLDAVLGEYQKGEGLTYELAHALISAIYAVSYTHLDVYKRQRKRSLPLCCRWTLCRKMM